MTKHAVKHRAGESAGKGVPLAGMEGPQKRGAPRCRMDGAVPEFRGGRADGMSPCGGGFQIFVEGDFPQSHHHGDALQQTKFLNEIRPTGFKLFFRWFIIRRGATDSGRHVTIRQLQPIVPMG